MRIPGIRIIVPLLAAVAVAGIARARPAGALTAAYASGDDERYCIEPGAEALFAEMLGRGQTLPGGCLFSDGKIERFSVLVNYTCGAERVVLQVVHPTIAPSGGVRTERFAIMVKSGVPPAGLVETIADRIRAREAAFAWTDLGRRHTPLRLLPVAVAALAAISAFWALRRAVARRRGGRPETHGPGRHQTRA